MVSCIVVAHTVGMYVYMYVCMYVCIYIVHTQYRQYTLFNRDALIDTKQEAIGYHSISPRGSFKVHGLAT